MRSKVELTLQELARITRYLQQKVDPKGYKIRVTAVSKHAEMEGETLFVTAWLKETVYWASPFESEYKVPIGEVFTIAVMEA